MSETPSVQAPLSPNPSPAGVDESVGARLASPTASSGKASLVPTSGAGRYKLFAIFTIAALVLSMLATAYLWRKLSGIQEHLARQSADASTISIEARSLAKNAQEVARDAAARSSLNETRLSEVALQRSQLDELMQSLSRSRDENLVVDIESALRLSQQQAQLTGSVEPLLAALKTADVRLAKSAQPRLNTVRRALSNDADRIKAATVTDIPNLLAKLDELTRLIDDLPVVNALASGEKLAESAATQSNAALSGDAAKRSKTDEAARAAQAASSWQATAGAWLHIGWTAARAELVKLVRVSSIAHPDAVLMTPEQTFFLRENLKLRLLNARMSLLSRQFASAKSDLVMVNTDLHKYMDPSAKASQIAFGLVQQAQGQLVTLAIPGLDESLAALSVAAAGR